MTKRQRHGVDETVRGIATDLPESRTLSSSIPIYIHRRRARLSKPKDVILCITGMGISL